MRAESTASCRASWSAAQLARSSDSSSRSTSTCRLHRGETAGFRFDQLHHIDSVMLSEPHCLDSSLLVKRCSEAL